jgi:hypothetical protein
LTKVTPEGLQQTARTFFTMEHLYGAIVGPYRPRHRTTIETLLANTPL